MRACHLQPYELRAQHYENPAGRLLLELMARKKSNLAVSVDVTKSSEFLRIVDVVGPEVCLIKTHIDIVEDFDSTVVQQLRELSLKHDFMIFEDRKFSDIGSTVALQYSSGLYKIASWADITNAHPIPGPSIVTGLAQVGLPLGRGLLLLAEMSTQGSLARGSYTEEAVRMARDHRDFVIGFVAQRRMEGVASADASSEDFLVFSPGVSLEARGDGKGQQYRSPREVVLDSGCDVIIVGRGIYGGGQDTERIRAQARRYRDEGWNAYLERIQQ